MWLAYNNFYSTYADPIGRFSTEAEAKEAVELAIIQEALEEENEERIEQL